MRRPGTERPRAFALPTGTTLRFILLIAAAAYALTQLTTAFSSVLITSVRLDEVLAYTECHQKAVEESARKRSAQDAAAGLAGDVDASQCHDPRAGMGLLLPVLVAVVFVVAIAAAYWLLPRWRISRRGYVALSGAVDGVVESRLTSLAERAGVEGRVTFLVEPLNPRVQGLAFGRAGRRHVVLSSGLLALHSRDRDAFDAVVLHELAHVRNRDLDIGFVTLLVGRCCLPLIPVLVMGLLGGISMIAEPAGTSGGALGMPAGPLPTAAIASSLSGSFGLLFLAGTVLLLRNAVLRSRELDADARAVAWTGTAVPLQRLFAHDGTPTAAAGGGSGYRRLFKVHPPAAERVRLAAQPSTAVRLGPLDLFAVGVITAYLYDLIHQGPLGGGTDTGTATEAAAACVASLLLVSAVATTVWRSADPLGLHHAEVRSAERRRELRTAGIGLGLGLCTARVLSPTLAMSSAMVGGRGLSMVLPYAALCAAAGWGVVCWLERVATAWAPAVRVSRRPWLLLCAVPVLAAAGTWPALLYFLDLPSATLYASSFVAPGWPGAVMLFWSAGHMSLVSTSVWAWLAIPTACALLLAGQWWSWRPSAAAVRGEFGPVRPPGWLWARLGVPTGLAASVLLTPVALLSPGVAGLWLSIAAAQLAAALWAGRRVTLLPVARVTLAAYGAGAVAMVAWVEQIGLLGCALGTDSCHVLPRLGELRLAVLTAGPGALLVAGVWAVVCVRRGGRHSRRS